MTTAEGRSVASIAQKPSLNPLSPEVLLNPAPFYKELRENDPVHWVEEMHAWLVTRHADVKECFRDPRLSSEKLKFFEYQLKGLEPDIISDFLQMFRHYLTMKDGSEHVRLRRRVNPGFSPQSLEFWSPAIRRIMNTLVDRVQHLGRMDLVKEISHVLPPLVIAEILGVPQEDRERFQWWSVRISEMSSPPPNADMREVALRANQSITEFRVYLQNLIQERRQTPGPDVISQMIHVQEEGGMSEEELIANVNLILMAGFLTTTDQLSNGVHALLMHPDQLHKLRADPGLLKLAVEEMMRFCPAVPSTFRLVREPMELRGRQLQAGDVVFLSMGSANQDPEAFTDPDRFDITRDSPNQKHMGFGFGAHHCLGAGLARRELEIAFAVLLERLPGLRLDEEQPPQLKCHSLLFRGFESLPVCW
jgi:cytochrome P450